jgi:hypothetical protein
MVTVISKTFGCKSWLNTVPLSLYPTNLC